MSAIVESRKAEVVQELEAVWKPPPPLRHFFTTVDHKDIGIRYIVTSFVFFVLAGLEAVAMRTQLAGPNNHVLGPKEYNEFFTMHGVTMIFLFVTPMLSGFGNYIVPLQIGARDMAFPRMNAFSYWVFLGSGIFMYSSLFFGLAPNDGWFDYVPLADRFFSPERNIDFYGFGLLFITISTTAGAVNFIVTIFKMRAPGMSLNRLPLFCWANLATSFSVIFALPALSAGNIMLELERKFNFRFFETAHGGDPLLWQHTFWIFGHPDVYIIFLPAVGIVSSVIPVFSQRPVVAYTWLALSTVATATIGFGVWVHHMFATGLPQISMAFFSAASLLITIPSGIQIFAWCATALKGKPVLKTPMLFILGFIVVFVIGGVTGVMFAAIPFDQQVTDSYFVVAHFHYVLFGGAVFPIFAGLYYWFPKFSGRMYDERLGKVTFWGVFVGFNLTFFPMHISGLLGMPRRVYTYPSGLGWDAYNLIATIGSYLLAASIGLIALNLLWSRRRGAPAGDDPWAGNTLEWATTSPPPHYNFPVIPTVRSADPNWDELDRAEDERRLERAELVLTDGHQALATTVLEAEGDHIVEMPSESPWPFAVALALLALFTAMLTDHWAAAAICAGLVALAVAGWHRQQPYHHETV
jgi:cytochrome c oxidase subunit I+III